METEENGLDEWLREDGENKWLHERLYQYAEWLEEEKELQTAAWKTQEQYVLDLPERKVEYADPQYLEFENSKQQEWKQVKKAQGKLISAWVWTVLFGILSVAAIVLMITSGGESVLGGVGLPVGVFGVIICFSGGLSKSEDYKYLKKTYVENVANMEKARRWVAYVEKFTSRYRASVKEAKAELKTLHEEMETLRYDWEDIPKDMRNPKTVRKIAKEIESSRVYTVMNAVENIQEREREENERFAQESRERATNTPKRGEYAHSWKAEMEKNDRYRQEQEEKRRAAFEAKKEADRAHAKKCREEVDEYHRARRVCQSCAYQSKCRRIGTPNCASYLPK